MADSEKPGRSKSRRVVSGVVLVALLSVLFAMFRKPTPVAEPMKPGAVAANVASFQSKMSAIVPQNTSTDADQSASPVAPEEVRLTVDEVQAALVQANTPEAIAAANSNPDSNAPPVTPSEQAILQSTAPVVTFENDVVKGQFKAELAGQPVYVTVAGHLGAKDGYATFEPTEFKVGDVSVPVSMVNDALQKKMADQHDRLKLPDFISDIAVQNGQLVIKRK